MGCKQSDLRGGQAPDDADKPHVPADCWYKQPLTELSLVPMTPFHENNRGRVVYATTAIPVGRELDRLPGGQPVVLHDDGVVDLDRDNLFAMAYLYNTALYTEHMWRTRVPHGCPNRYQRPFNDMMITVRMIVDGNVFPDVAPHEYSVQGCSATLNAPDALARWKHVPLVMVPDPEHYTTRSMRLFDGVVRSFAAGVSNLPPGVHTMLIEVCYGCANENHFCSGYVALGEIRIQVSADTANRLRRIASTLPAAGGVKRYANIAGAEGEKRCTNCNMRMALRCTVCGAAVCGVADCVFLERTGYPICCESHPTPAVAGM